MIETATLDALVLHDPDGPLRVTGWAETIAPRVTRAPNPRMHGAVDRTGLLAGRLFSITGNAVGATRAAVADAVASLTGGVLPPEARTLTWRRDGDAVDLTAEVVIDAPLEVPGSYAEPLVVRWGLALYAPDPRAYSAVEQDAEQRPIPAISEGELTVVNGGNFATPPVVRVYGPLSASVGTDLLVTNTTTGRTLRLVDPTAVLGDTIVLDFAARRVTFDPSGAPDPVELPQLVDPVASDWWELAPGSNDLVLNGSAVMDGDTGWDVTWRDAWV